MDKADLIINDNILVRNADGSERRARYVGSLGDKPMVTYHEGPAGSLLRVEPDELRLDPSLHYHREMDNAVCVCGHRYHRHFDGFEEDARGAPKHAGCKYCLCTYFTAPTTENQRNRIHEHRVYTIRMTRQVVVELRPYNSFRPRYTPHPEMKPLTLNAGEVLHDVGLVRYEDGSCSLHIIHDGGNGKVIADGFPADSFEVIGRRWDGLYYCHVSDSDLVLEQYQPEGLRLAKPVPFDEMYVSGKMRPVEKGKRTLTDLMHWAESHTNPDEPLLVVGGHSYAPRQIATEAVSRSPLGQKLLDAFQSYEEPQQPAEAVAAEAT
jgi:hypothetical protein